jgi:protein-S-isoprenylcysteine O-methyltransferase Ste14
MSMHPIALEKNIGSSGRTNMNQLVMQVVLAVGSWPGILMGWMSGYRGQGRIPQPLAGIITNLGPLIMIAPWIAMPLLAQPRLVGSGRTIVFILGILLLAAAALIIIWATPFIFPAAKMGGDELDPEFLVVKGPYRWVRHAQYLGGVLGLIGWVFCAAVFIRSCLAQSAICYSVSKHTWKKTACWNRSLGPNFNNLKSGYQQQFLGVLEPSFFSSLTWLSFLWLYLVR